MMEFLGEIKANAEEDSNFNITKTEMAFSEMVNILIMHAQSDHVTLQVCNCYIACFTSTIHAISL